MELNGKSTSLKPPHPLPPLMKPYYASKPSTWNSKSQNKTKNKKTYPNVVIVTMVYQKAAGMLWNLVRGTFFSA